LETSDIKVAEKVPASRKLQADDARQLLENAQHLIAIKGKKVATFAPGKTPEQAAIDAMLGPTGNLRAPTLRVGKTLIVGFDEATLTEHLL
jgi:hypothetical protein